jgi:hypothetical protein
MILSACAPFERKGPLRNRCGVPSASAVPEGRLAVREVVPKHLVPGQGQDGPPGAKSFSIGVFRRAVASETGLFSE